MHLGNVGVAGVPWGRTPRPGGGEEEGGGEGERGGMGPADERYDAVRITEQNYSSMIDSRRWAFKAHLNVMAFSWYLISGWSSFHVEGKV